MDMGDAGSLVYILKDGQGYLVDDASKMAVRGEVPTVSTSEIVSADEGEAQEIPCTVTTVNVNGQDCEALSYTATDANGQTATVSYCLVGDDLKYVVTDAAEAAPSWSTASRAPLWTRISSTSLRIIRS